MLPKLCILHLTLGYTISDRTTEIPLQTEFDYGRKFNTTQQIGTYQPTFGIDMAQADGVTVGIPSTGTLESVTSYEDPPQNALDPVLEGNYCVPQKNRFNIGYHNS